MLPCQGAVDGVIGRVVVRVGQDQRPTGGGDPAAQALAEPQSLTDHHGPDRPVGGDPDQLIAVDQPQPGALDALVQSGSILALEDLGIDVDQLKETVGESFVELGEVDGKHYVYLVTGDTGYQRHEVKVANVSGDQVRVLEGLSQGQRIVVKGAVLIKGQELKG